MQIEGLRLHLTGCLHSELQPTQTWIRSSRPAKNSPSMRSIASSASRWSMKRTKAKPRGSPVRRSLGMYTSPSSPYLRRDQWSIGGRESKRGCNTNACSPSEYPGTTTLLYFRIQQYYVLERRESYAVGQLVPVPFSVIGDGQQQAILRTTPLASQRVDIPPSKQIHRWLPYMPTLRLQKAGAQLYLVVTPH